MKKIKESQKYLRTASAQLNEVEWSAVLIPGLTYLALKGDDAPIISTLAVAGQALYFWPRALIGNANEGGSSTPLPPYVPGALMRYGALALLAHTLWGMR